MPRGPKIMLVAGEASGDHHAAALAGALKRLAKGVRLYGLGGREMAKAGVRVDLDLASKGVIGLVEVLRHAGYFRRAFAQALGLLKSERPDLLVLVDYPGFNLRLAKAAHGLGIPVCYYVSPQVWAWKRGRVKTMARILRKMLVTFPFEKPIYDAAGLDCVFVGNPLVDALPRAAKGAAGRRALGLKGGGPWVGLLPGSREQEVRWLLPVMLESARHMALAKPQARFVVVKPQHAPLAWYAPLAKAREQGLALRLESRPQASAYRLRAAMDLALVASGTATLETAMLGTPFLILYRLHPLTYAIGKLLVKIHSIGLANVVAGRRAVPEFLQGALKPEAIAAAGLKLLDYRRERQAQLSAMANAVRTLGKPGVAKRAAREVLNLLGKPG